MNRVNQLNNVAFKNSDTNLSRLSNDDIMGRIDRSVRDERGSLGDFLELLSEVDARRLYVHEASPSLFQWLMDRWNFSESAAYKRIAVARKGRQIPMLIQSVRDGRLHLSGAATLAPHVTVENAESLIQQASGKSKRDIEVLILRVGLTGGNASTPKQAGLPAPKSSFIRIVPAPTQIATPLFAVKSESAPVTTPPPPAVGVRVAVTLPTDVYAMLDDLMKNQPGDDVADVLVDAIRVLHAKRDPAARVQRTMKRLARKERPSGMMAKTTNPLTRNVNTRPAIPADVRAKVWIRDGGRCTYVAPDGCRCTAAQRLEFDHVKAVARGGATDVDSLRLRCSLHNKLAAIETFGGDFMSRWIGCGTLGAKVTGA